MRRLIGRARSNRLLTGGVLLTTLLAIVSTFGAHRQIVVNTSPSVVPGLYVRSAQTPAVGCLVEFRVPPAAAGYIRARTRGRTGGEDWYILKPVAAGPGDDVDCTGEWLLINGRRVAPMPPSQDAAGFALPAWREHRILRTDEFFVFSNRISNSFDSRCYGPVQRRDITAVRRPLLTW